MTLRGYKIIYGNTLPNKRASNLPHVCLMLGSSFADRLPTREADLACGG